MAALMKWSHETSGRVMQETLKMLARPAISLLLIAFGCSVDTADLGSNCDCPYPPILGGDCCTVRNACETDGVDCELLRDSILTLRAAGRPGRGDSAEDDAYFDCISKLSAALAERCAFVEPECGEPSEDYATFGDPNEEGYSECTDSETRAVLRCG